jgi:aerobic C4-dicarboxylate transport protein
MMVSDTALLAGARPARRDRPWYTQLWAQVLIAMVAGVLLGHLAPDLGAKRRSGLSSRR